ncbi:MAG: hypothetical protein AAFY76_18165 [Cyanobacteria bacterium J06649_11]
MNPVLCHATVVVCALQSDVLLPSHWSGLATRVLCLLPAICFGDFALKQMEFLCIFFTFLNSFL